MGTSSPDNRWSGVIGPHGGYEGLKSYQASVIIHDLTLAFCDRHIDRRSRTHDQMVQAARSGKQNIAEGSMASGTSSKTELKLVGVARASLEELLVDFHDFLRQGRLTLWGKDDARSQAVRRLAYATARSAKSYEPFCRDAESAANTLVCLIHQANYLLDRQLRFLDARFQKEGGFTEKLYRSRVGRRGPIGPMG
jgi:four helix bundle suffix protein